MKAYSFISVILIFLFFLPYSEAQSSKFLGEKIDQDFSDDLQGIFTEWSIYEIDATAMSQFLEGYPSEKSMELYLGNEFSWQMDLERHHITTPSTQLVTATAQGETLDAYFFDRAFFGKLITNNLHSEVRLTTGENFIYGFVKNNSQTIFIEPLRRFSDNAQANWFVIYDVKDVVPNTTLTCGAKDTNSQVENFSKNKNTGDTKNSQENMACLEVELSVAADFSMYQKNNASTGDLLNYIFGVLNNVNGLFDNEFNDEIRFVVRNIFLSTCTTCDPWTNSADADILLADFISWGNGGGFCAGLTDLQELWTDRDLFSLDAMMNMNTGTIGLAPGLGNVCEADGFHILEDYTSSADLIRGLVAHEIGHNFNLPHNYEIDDACDPPGRNALIMDPFVSTTMDWSDGTQVCAMNSVATFDAYYPSLSCLDGCSTLSNEVWVDFNYNGCIQLGTFDEPFNVLAFGVYWVEPGGLIKIKSSITDETLSIEKPCSIETWMGNSTVGQN